jgi:5-methylcytosine-specific restriction endonuclease McrA
MLRRCFREPIPELNEAAGVLSLAVSAHIAGQQKEADELIRQADTTVLRDWTESLWGKKSVYAKFQSVPNTDPILPLEQRKKPRMPGAAVKRELIERDGHHCRFCGTPVIREEVRRCIRKIYPGALRWSPGNKNQHFGFQALWLHYDHIIPWARGGTSTLDNMIVTCAPCNCARMNYTLEQSCLINPTKAATIGPSWDGLERFLDFQRRTPLPSFPRSG